MCRALRCNVDPLVKDDSRHGPGHHLHALIPVHPSHLRAEDLSNACAVYMDKRLDATATTVNPTKWHPENISSDQRVEIAISVQVNDDGRLHPDARLNTIAAEDFSGFHQWLHLGIAISQFGAHRGKKVSPLCVQHGAFGEDYDRGLTGRRRDIPSGYRSRRE